MDALAEIPEDVIRDFKTMEMRPSQQRSNDEIRRQFKKLAIKCHPDKSTEADSKEQFQQLNRAYESLITLF